MRLGVDAAMIAGQSAAIWREVAYLTTRIDRARRLHDSTI